MTAQKLVGSLLEFDDEVARQLAALPDAWIQKPWEAPPLILKAAKVSLPRDYPLPIVDHAVARDRALAGFASLKVATA